MPDIQYFLDIISQEKNCQYQYMWEMLFSTDIERETCENVIRIVFNSLQEISGGNGFEKSYNENKRDYFLSSINWGLFVSHTKIPTDPREMVEEYLVAFRSFGFNQTIIEGEIGRIYYSFEDAKPANMNIIIQICSNLDWYQQKQIWSELKKQFTLINYKDKTLTTTYDHSPDKLLNCLSTHGETAEHKNLIDTINELPYLEYKNYKHYCLEIENKNLSELEKIFSLIPQPEKIEDIHLINCRLKTLPENIKHFTKLESLYLDNNEFKAVPDILPDFIYLKTLSMVNNSLNSIDIVDVNSSLENLFLDSNKITKIENNIKNLPRLKSISLNNNKIAELPLEFFTLSELEYLNIENNVLISLSENFSSLINLKVLNVNNNFLNKLPDSLCHCTSLENLFIENNAIMKLPENIGNLINLKNFMLSNNEISSLTDGFCNLINLTAIYMDNNALIELPAQIGRLINVEHLGLNNNRLKDLPKSIQRMLHLVSIYLDNNCLNDFTLDLSRLNDLRLITLINNPLLKQRLKELETNFPKECIISY